MTILLPIKVELRRHISKFVHINKFSVRFSLRWCLSWKRKPGSWRKLHCEELHNLYSSSNIIKVIKSRLVWLVAYVAYMVAMRNASSVLVGKSCDKRQIGVIGLDGGIILKLIWQKLSVKQSNGLDWVRIDSSVGILWIYDNENLSPTNSGSFLTNLVTFSFLDIIRTTSSGWALRAIELWWQRLQTQFVLYYIAWFSYH